MYVQFLNNSQNPQQLKSCRYFILKKNLSIYLFIYQGKYGDKYHY